MGKFNVLDILNTNSQNEKSINNDFKITMIDIDDINDSKSNFYDTEDIEDLVNSIEMFGIQQNLIVKKIDNNKFELIAGHRRKLACLKLVQEGKEEYKKVPCIIESSNYDIREKLLLICTNSTARVLSDYEKVEQVKQLKELLIEYKKEHKLPGRIRSLVADTLNISQTQVARMDSIANNLSDNFKNELKEDKINISTAYEISGLDKNKQKEIYEITKEKESSENVTFNISLKEIKKIKELEKQETDKIITEELEYVAEPENIETVEADSVTVFSEEQEESEIIDPEHYTYHDVDEELDRLMDYIETYRKTNDISLGRKKTKMRLDAIILLDKEIRKLEEFESVQPDLPILKNNEQRKEFIDSYATWPIWIDTEETGERYYRYDLSDKVSIVVRVNKKHSWETYKETKAIEYGAEQYYLLGIKSEWTSSKGNISIEDETRTFYECNTNKSLLVEYLKNFQKGDKS